MSRCLRQTELQSHISRRVGANALPGAWVTSEMNKPGHSPISITKVVGVLAAVDEVVVVVLGLVAVGAVAVVRVVGARGRRVDLRRPCRPRRGRRRRRRRIWVLALLVVSAHVAVCSWFQCRRWQEKGVASPDRISGSGTSRARLVELGVSLDSPRPHELGGPILGLRNENLWSGALVRAILRALVRRFAGVAAGRRVVPDRRRV